MGDQEIKDRIELEISGSTCGSCCAMASVQRSESGAITGVYCLGYKGACVMARGDTCEKHGPLDRAKTRMYLPRLARAAREQKAAHAA